MKNIRRTEGKAELAVKTKLTRLIKLVPILIKKFVNIQIQSFVIYRLFDLVTKISKNILIPTLRRQYKFQKLSTFF